MALPSRSKVHGPLRSALLALVAALVGGIIGWTAAFMMNTVWGLAVGVVVLIALDGLLARPNRLRGTVPTMLGWSFAFILLTWPPLWLIVGLVRYRITGETLGN